MGLNLFLLVEAVAIVVVLVVAVVVAAAPPPLFPNPTAESTVSPKILNPKPRKLDLTEDFDS